MTKTKNNGKFLDETSMVRVPGGKAEPKAKELGIRYTYPEDGSSGILIFVSDAWPFVCPDAEEYSESDPDPQERQRTQTRMRLVK